MKQFWKLICLCLMRNGSTRFLREEKPINYMAYVCLLHLELYFCQHQQCRTWTGFNELSMTKTEIHDGVVYSYDFRLNSRIRTLHLHIGFISVEIKMISEKYLQFIVRCVNHNKSHSTWYESKLDTSFNFSANKHSVMVLNRVQHICTVIKYYTMPYHILWEKFVTL